MSICHSGLRSIADKLEPHSTADGVEIHIKPTGIYLIQKIRFVTKVTKVSSSPFASIFLVSEPHENTHKQKAFNSIALLTHCGLSLEVSQTERSNTNMSNKSDKDLLNNQGHGWHKTVAKKIEPRTSGGTREEFSDSSGSYIVERNGFGEVVRVTKK